MKHIACSFAAMIAAFGLVVATTAARADNNRLELAEDSNWTANTGFYLDLENNTASYGSAQPLGALTLALGVANGSSWRFIIASPQWQYGHQYHVECTISPTNATMSLDGQSIGTAPGSFVADSSDGFIANQVPLWACADADYWICQRSVSVRDGASDLVSQAFPVPAIEIARYMFTPGQQLSAPPLALTAGSTVVIDASFTLVSKLASAPLVDTFGQNRFGAWPTKIETTAQLIASGPAEEKILDAMPGPTGRDKFGGDREAGWRRQPTGYFTVTKHNGFWWLVTPDGNPCFYTGVDDAVGLGGDLATPITGRTQLFANLPSPTGALAAAYQQSVWGDSGTTYFSFVIANAIKKYGANWMQRSKNLLAKRLDKWGFCGIGKWSSTPGNLPYISNLYYSAPVLYDAKPDVFDPAAISAITSSLAPQVQASVNDPFLVGWAVGNEEPDCVAYGTVSAILQLTSPAPGKEALVDQALELFYHGSVIAMARAWGVSAATRAQLYAQALSAPAAEQEPLREFYERAYFRTMYDIVKTLDPNHIYFGDWQVPNWNISPNDWLIDAKYCDVMGYDNYSANFADNGLAVLAAEVGKPILCGEFSYAPTYGGLEGFGQYGTSANYDADAGQDYQNWIEAATQNPYCVGGCWFMYRDEPITGRGPGAELALIQGENYAFGVVDTADQPKWQLVDAMAQANLAADADRIASNNAGTAK